jgi:hypothetical protein
VRSGRALQWTPKRPKGPWRRKGLVAQPRTASQIGPVLQVASAGEPFRTLLSGFEPHGRRGHLAVQGLPRARRRRHHQPISEPNAFPRIPQGDIITVDWGVLSDC